MNNPTDFLGNVIRVGDNVVVPHTGANKMILGEVVSISTKQCRIKCIKGHELVGRDFKTGRSSLIPEITQRNHSHCVVVNDQMVNKNV